MRDVDRLRRMTGVSTTDYTDSDLAEAMDRYPLEDARGEGPLIESGLDPGTLETNPDWEPTYDLNAAAADIWAEVAAGKAACFDFSADGGNYSRSQAYEQAMKQSRYYRARRSLKTITQRPEPLLQGHEELDLDDADD
jgi:hypothetical protein